jgi:hypothetical protein
MPVAMPPHNINVRRRPEMSLEHSPARAGKDALASAQKGRSTMADEVKKAKLELVTEEEQARDLQAAK